MTRDKQQQQQQQQQEERKRKRKTEGLRVIDRNTGQEIDFDQKEYDNPLYKFMYGKPRLQMVMSLYVSISIYTFLPYISSFFFTSCPLLLLLIAYCLLFR